MFFSFFLPDSNQQFVSPMIHAFSDPSIHFRGHQTFGVKMDHTKKPEDDVPSRAHDQRLSVESHFPPLSLHVRHGVLGLSGVLNLVILTLKTLRPKNGLPNKR